MPFQKSLDVLPAGPLESICRHMRTKSMFVAGELEPVPEVPGAGSGHCWCNLTQHVMGPDAQLVDRASCSSARPCYVATL